MSFLYDECVLGELIWFLDPYNKTGCRYVLVDAYNNPTTLSFYEANGFATVFSTEQQESEYRHLGDGVKLNTRLMYYDLMCDVTREK